MTLDGNRIRLFMESNELSREDLASQLRCGRETVDRLLTGKAPRAETLIALAKVMGCQVEDLVSPAVAATAVKRPA